MTLSTSWKTPLFTETSDTFLTHPKVISRFPLVKPTSNVKAPTSASLHTVPASFAASKLLRSSKASTTSTPKSSTSVQSARLTKTPSSNRSKRPTKLVSSMNQSLSVASPPRSRLSSKSMPSMTSTHPSSAFAPSMHQRSTRLTSSRTSFQMPSASSRKSSPSPKPRS